MKCYNAIVPGELVEKLYKAGCPNIGRYEEADGSVKYSEATYADIFDGLIEKGVAVAFSREKHWERIQWTFSINTQWVTNGDEGETWHDAANAAIEKAIEILKEKGAGESAPRK